MSEAIELRKAGTDPLELDMMQLGRVLAQSGFFSDSREAAQAVVKVLAGRELGFGPIASMRGVNIIKGKVSLAADLQAAAIKSSGKYDYRITHHDTERCSITFLQGGQEVGVSEFTMSDAKAAGLLANDTWRKYPRNMLFARAMSNGARWYCPDVFGGPVYDPSELRDIKEPEMTLEAVSVEPPKAIQAAQPAVPVEPLQATKRPRTRKDLEDRYGQLIAEAVQWNADDRHEPIEFRPYNESWTDDELRQFGVELATTLDRAKPRAATTSA